MQVQVRNHRDPDDVLQTVELNITGETGGWKKAKAIVDVPNPLCAVTVNFHVGSKLYGAVDDFLMHSDFTKW